MRRGCTHTKQKRFDEGEPQFVLNMGRRGVNEIRLGSPFLASILISLPCPRLVESPIHSRFPLQGWWGVGFFLRPGVPFFLR